MKEYRCSKCHKSLSFLNVITEVENDKEKYFCDKCDKIYLEEKEVKTEKKEEKREKKEVHQMEEPPHIPLGKFIFLSIITFGIFQLVWFYRCWKFFMYKEDLDISPFWRAWFGIFFIASLSTKILGYAKKEGYTKEYSPAWITISWIILLICGRIEGWIAFLSFLSFWPLIAPLNAMNYYTEKTEKVKPFEIEEWVIVIIILSILLWIFFLTAIFI